MADDDVLLLLKDEEKEKLKLQIKAGIHARIGEIEADIAPEQMRNVSLWPRIAVAAAAVAAITLGVWLYSNKYQDASIKTGSTASVNDIAPGKNGATITLANGKVIELSDAKSGVIVGEGLKYDDGAAVQGGDPDIRQDDVMQMTASTARGQTYQFTLSDGTKVWLNADSKLEFPSNFVNGKTRNVKLSGEGYFEVAKDKAHPFLVESEGQIVEVLGTHFNINSYADEASAKTTLLEGSVRVLSSGANAKDLDASYPLNDKGGERSIILKPNQQSVLTSTGRIKVENIDPESVIAWKNGEFMFNDEQLNSIMRKLAKWYNVEVIYKDNQIGEKIFGGTISRFGNVSDVLRMLELTGEVHFKVEGRRIVVTK
jgi:ferric-dicitrate binding protein FerR (iron transport regulator)